MAPHPRLSPCPCANDLGHHGGLPHGALCGRQRTSVPCEASDNAPNDQEKGQHVLCERPPWRTRLCRARGPAAEQPTPENRDGKATGKTRQRPVHVVPAARLGSGSPEASSAQGEEGGSRRPSRGFSAQHCASPRGVDADETVAPAGSAGRRAELPGPEPRGHVTPAACGRLRPPGAAPTSVLDALSSTDSHLSLQSGGWLCRTPTCSGPGGRQLRALKLRFKASTAGRGPAWSGKRLGVFRRLCAHPAGPGQAPAGRPGRAGVSCGVGRPRGASVSHLESPEGAERSRGAHLQPALCPPPP